MFEGTEAVQRCRRWAATYRRGVVGDVEVLNEFVNIVMEAPLTATEECLTELPTAVRPLLLESLSADPEDASHNHWIVNVPGWLNLGIDVAQQEQYHQQMQPHYRAVAKRLLTLLRAGTTT